METKRKKKFKYIISGILVVVALSLFAVVKLGSLYNFYILPPSAKQYGNKAIEIMNQEGIYRNTKEWESAKQIALDDIKNAKSYSDTYKILSKAIKVAGGKHSAFIEPTSKNSAKESSFQLPKVDVKDDIVYIKLPEYTMSSSEKAEKYSKTVLDFLENNKDAKGIVLDLRGNTGGDMGPMVAAISPILPDGDLLYFEIKNQKIPVTLSKGSISGGGSPMKVKDFKLSHEMPIAILTDDMTASSGEAVLLSFRGLKNVKVFGKDTAGYASCNTVKNLYDGATLQITIGKNIARTGEEFCEDPISPDVKTKTPKEDAIDWIGYVLNDNNK